MPLLQRRPPSLVLRFYAATLLLFLLLAPPPATAQGHHRHAAGDGVIISQADYQGLQAIKHDLSDPYGFLQSWNASGLTACSGAWAGIKCVKGSVVAITLPWKGLAGRLSARGLGQLTGLRRLSLHDNAIAGEIPSSLGFLPDLRGVYLFNNRFSGQIPASIGGCLALQQLDASGNRLSGSVPPAVANSTKLIRLNLSRNALAGEIPSLTANLQSFNVSYNNLSGPVPFSLAQKFGPDSFAGNVQLCGYSAASIPCPSPAPSSPAEESNNHGGSNRKKKLILIIVGVVAGLLLLLLLCCLLLCFLTKRRSSTSTRTRSGKQQQAAGGGRGEKPGVGEGEESGGGDVGGKLVHFDGPLAFTADDLLCATAEIMGKSTYGTVYKATLEDGSLVAVKRLREKITKGHREFEAEAAVLGKIRHPNLLALRAYYLGPKGEKLLVFDYMPTGSLSAFLHATARAPNTPVDWATRMTIAKGTSRGLAYLHDDMSIIHGNLTASNVLLDEHNNPKISDFGLSRLMTAAANSNVLAAAGALGYRAPELSKLKKANAKTDVYSLGVIILELLTGKSPADNTNGMDLPQWVASIVKEEWTSEVFDLELMRDAASGNVGDELMDTLKLALHCVDPSPSVRPEAREVLRQLEQIRPGSDSGAGPSEEGAHLPVSAGGDD
ncbi:hypothetical protein PR202_gb16636 [Eleusine coracana subsp. coracana]|uniref:Protein kinase domain-containing protein n=1 Tax=Eleusine coracana subsp. coracana TaxID=191504 RepID=A0AAV5F0V6_ELECO|nr:hypothetical protein PR202_gb16636 [Eleusine coracana subsp. coracana]